jgi:hypothetical protein
MFVDPYHDFNPEEGDSTFLRNAGELLHDYMASHARRQSPL